MWSRWLRGWLRTMFARMHQSLHHVVADAPWSDEAVLRQVRDAVLPAMQKHGPVVCWIVDDTGFPKKGSHSVGVARQYCGQVGKQDNCRVAVSLSVATWASSLPIAYRLYLPEVWASDKKRRKAAGIPEDVAVPNEAADCAGSDPRRRATGGPTRSGRRRCRLWRRWAVPIRRNETRPRSMY